MTCNHNRQYNDEFDAYYCDVCDSWLEAKCTDDLCDSGYCANRPDKPSEVTK